MRHVESKKRAAVKSRVISMLAMIGCLGALMLFSGSRSVHARLNPYYILSGKSFGQVSPRILFVLDTSGSMAWRADTHEETCAWNSCEDEGAERGQSRIHAARTAIHNVVLATKDNAKFSLMTFDQLRPPGSKSQIPSRCSSGKGAPRFAWFSYYTDGWSWWKTVDPHGYAGSWRLCGENRPYPYLRWDHLGTGSSISADDQVGTVPESPLISTQYSDFSSSENSKRKVQWFPDFLGVRVNLNETNDPDRALLNATYGDYGNSYSRRLSRVWKQDFYYWPYVDGFPGYSMYMDEGWSDIGVVGSSYSVSSASLYAPFYFESAESLPAQERGPGSSEESVAKILSLTDKMHQGGVDAVGGTPWKSVVGPIVSSPPQSNRSFSHTTIASYLKFAQNVEESSLCVPQVAVLLTDGDPSPSSEGGAGLYTRLSALRNQLNSKVYVVGFFVESYSLNKMACAAAGSNNSSSPCYGTSTNDWDTCANPSDPEHECAHLASSASELATTLTSIIKKELLLNIPSGPGAVVNDFGSGSGEFSEGEVVQTTVTAYTESTGWKGHVTRKLCTAMDEDNPDVPADYCEDKPFEDTQELFGPCPHSRVWDAGACLQQTEWNDRRLFSHDLSNKVFRISQEDGRASSQFRDLLNEGSLGLAGAPFSMEDADKIVSHLLGKDFPEGWKLAGLANSAPISVRRIPRYRSNLVPSVPIRDPHCAGRMLKSPVELPLSLESFAKDAWSQTAFSPTEHLEYQEAVMIGDDMGIVHAFQMDSGNELWGFIPRYLLKNAIAQASHGPANRGQPDKIEGHIYGAAGTLNHGFAWDEEHETWRHLASLSSGKGGNDLIVLDLSHMSPESEDGPLEVLWSSDDPSHKSTYDQLLGETWARPALSYRVPDDRMGQEPEAFLIFGSGYPDSPESHEGQGKTLLLVDALTGEIQEQVRLPDVEESELYESNFGTVVDAAVGTNCISRFWAEMQETYIVDPAGRLFRWDLGRESAHAGDSGERWDGVAIPALQFHACQGESDFDCTVSNSHRRDPFLYAPAVVANDRLDSDGLMSGIFEGDQRDQFLIALVSGSAFEDTLDAGLEDSDYHSSLYLIADDHRAQSHAGLEAAENGSLTAAGDSESFFRAALSEVERTRVFTPVPGGHEYTEVRRFSKRARPLRAPKITVTGYIEESEGEQVVSSSIEIVYIEFTIYEPGNESCDPIWYDQDAKVWHQDEGATYLVRLRLTVKDGEGFDFTEGAGVFPKDRYGFDKGGLQMIAPEQVREGACQDGVCGPLLVQPSPRPCTPEADQKSMGGNLSISLYTGEIEGFSPNEVLLDGNTP